MRTAFEAVRVELTRRPWQWSIFLNEQNRRRFLFPIAVFVGVRVWLSFWASVSVSWLPVAVEKMRLYYGMAPLRDFIWGPWQRWDTIWYTKIAEQGYAVDDLSTAFFPLYPILIKIAAPLFGNYSVVAAIVIASLASLASFILLFRLAAYHLGVVVAQRTVLLLATFPTAFFLMAAYTESLFLALALGAIFCAQRGHWRWASILVGLVALTRPQGALLILALGVEFILQYREKRVTLSRALNLFLAGLGALAFPVFLTLKFQNPLLWFDIQGFWHRSALPWTSLGAGISVVLTAKDWFQMIFALPDLAFALLFLGLCCVAVFRMRLTFAVYMAAVILPPLFSISTYEPLLPMASMSRYVLVAFPGFMLLAQISWLARWYRWIAAGAFLLQTLICILFTQWIFVG